MKLHLDFHPADPGFRICHADQIALSGSCFSEHMAARLYDAGFECLSNPQGIQFNPLSIFQFLLDCLSGVSPDRSLLLQRESLWYSYEAHSSINAANEEALLKMLKAQRENFRKFLASAKFLFITPGTAWYYTLSSSNSLVNNCHRQAPGTFVKSIAGTDEITALGNKVLLALQELNPELRVIFTVSPVKHLRDGITENFLSKSTLRMAIHALCKEHPHSSYFPAYELIADDLRDYRFYEPDLAHPSVQAIDYVWQRFGGTYFTAGTQKLTALCEERTKALRHIPLDPAKTDKKFQEYLLGLDDRIRQARTEQGL